jgi:signal transduction histidine kinase
VIYDPPTGDKYIGDIPCGTHLCEFYSTDEELANTLAPYFAAGLRRNEFCFWITSDPVGAEGVKLALRKAAPHLGQYLDRGQLEIRDSQDWYLRGGRFDADRVLGQWSEKEKWALEHGYNGLRVSGDMAWLEKRDWPDFMVYEAEVDRVFPQHRMVGLCTYPLNDCRAEAMLEVVRNHQFALVRVAGNWEMIGSSSFNTLDARVPQRSTSEQSQRLSADVLERHDEERRWIATQLHEVTAQNVSAIAIYLSNLQQKASWPSAIKFLLAKCDSLCEQSLEQILNLSHRLHPLLLDELGLAPCLGRYIEDFVKRSRIHVEFEAGPDIGRLPPDMETHLFRVAQEGLSNVLLHSGSPTAIVRLHRREDHVTLQIEDFGQGVGVSAREHAPASAGKPRLGIFGMQERLRKIGGQLEIRSNNQGTVLTATLRAS